MHAVSNGPTIWRVSLARIEQVVSAHLGPGRVPGNAAGPCFSRQVSMYLAKHVGRWSLSQIGKFYNGRHHTTVLHAIERIEKLRSIDESVDALIEVLINELAAAPQQPATRLPFMTRTALIDAVTTQVMNRLTELRVIEPQRGSVPKIVHTGG